MKLLKRRSDFRFPISDFRFFRDSDSIFYRIWDFNIIRIYEVQFDFGFDSGILVKILVIFGTVFNIDVDHFTLRSVLFHED
jgi:hypothetical protein